jgi:hypothetical protein
MPIPAGSRYVAMGGSFAAGPGLPSRVPGSPRRAGRPTGNYAHLVASELGLDLHDVTFSGATTSDLLGPSAFGDRDAEPLHQAEGHPLRRGYPPAKDARSGPGTLTGHLRVFESSRAPAPTLSRGEFSIPRRSGGYANGRTIPAARVAPAASASQPKGAAGNG